MDNPAPGQAPQRSSLRGSGEARQGARMDPRRLVLAQVEEV